MTLLLEERGHEVKVAYSGESAMELAQTYTPDIWFVDIGLPDIDGYEVARRSRALANGSGVRLIAITGYGTATDRQRAMEAGFDEHLVKPVEVDHLVRLIASL